jgi:hypothetical protein
MVSEMADVFISYASENEPTAELLAKALEQHGCTVWWDRRIPPGATFENVISDALSSAKCIVVLWSKASIASEWVKEEAADAARRRILVPALIERVEIPLGFRRIEAAQLTDWRGQSDHAEFRQLLAAVAGMAKLTHTLSNGVEQAPVRNAPLLPRLLAVVLIVVSFFLGMYLYGVTENMIRRYVQHDLQTPLPRWVPALVFLLTAIPVWIGGFALARKAWRHGRTLLIPKRYL